mmetsp:Transcript_73697/g.111109  ORF Transcript_73697/g.111109 Transcript_73697/m.111109 type:complete len:84 (-) Transcript_73697:50-301(-)
MDMVKRYFPEDTQVLLPKPTWPNHNNMAKEINLNLVEYTYYNPANKGLNLDGFINDLKRVPEKSVVLLHACAHNPTGCDPNPD